MLADRIYGNIESGFNCDRARELLSLVEVAHDRYQNAKENPTYKWEADLKPIVVNELKYEILVNLGFAQYFFFRRRRVPFGFIARRETAPGRFEIFVVFRGTMNPAEWISNFKITQRSYEKVESPVLPKRRDSQNISPQELGKVHRGFYITYTRPDPGNFIDKLIDLNPKNNAPSMRDVAEKILNDPQKCPQGSPLFVTGHSLGGALATLSALHIHIAKTIPFENPILYTFASPRVGNRQFARQFDKFECYRVVNSEDIVPVVPLPTLLLALGRTPLREVAPYKAKCSLTRLDYEHIGQPIYFTVQNGYVSENHIIPTYMKVLSQLPVL